MYIKCLNKHVLKISCIKYLNLTEFYPFIGNCLVHQLPSYVFYINFSF